MTDDDTRLRQAWDRFHAAAAQARALIEATPRFARGEHRAAAYHALIEAQAMAYNWIVAPRLDHPRLFTHTSWATYLYTVAGNCPDFVYGILPLNGRGRYRLRIRFGDTRLLLVQVLNLPMGVDGSRCTGNYEFAPEDARNGHLEVLIGADENTPHAIAIDRASGYNLLILRRLMGDWRDDPGTLEIEVVAAPPLPPEPDANDVAQRIEMAADFQLAVIRNWAVGLYAFVEQVCGGRRNAWGPVPGAMMEAIAGSASCHYAFLIVELEDDEALIVEMAPPLGSAYWSLQIVDVWSKSLDFMHAQTDVNMRHAAIDDDGLFRAVICEGDPGFANWLDPCGRREAVLALRDYRSRDYREPTARVVRKADLAHELPATTRRVNAQERAAQVGRRRPAILALYGG